MLEGLMRMLGWSIAVLGRCGATTTRTFVKRFDVTIVGWSFPIRQGVARIAASIFQGGTLACHPVWHWPRASHLSEMAPTRKEFLQWEERSDGKFRQAFVLCSDKLVSRCTKERNVAQCTWQGELAGCDRMRSHVVWRRAPRRLLTECGSGVSALSFAVAIAEIAGRRR
jgi:hypothetical protein